MNAIDQAYASNYGTKNGNFRNKEPYRYTYDEKAEARRQSLAAQFKNANPYFDFFKMVDDDFILAMLMCQVEFKQI